MHENYHFYYSDLYASVKDVLGIDMRKSLTDQKNIVNALLSKLPPTAALGGRQ